MQRQPHRHPVVEVGAPIELYGDRRGTWGTSLRAKAGRLASTTCQGLAGRRSRLPYSHFPVAPAALTRTLRTPASVRGRSRDTPIQAFREADLRARVEVIGSSLSFVLAATTVALIATKWGKTTACDLTCAYVAAGVFEIVGILSSTR